MNEYNHWLTIPLSFLVALILTLLPMPDWAEWFRPCWVLMILTYWIINIPKEVNIGTAFTLGIILDVLNGTLLGEHAFALAIVAYFITRMYTQLRMYPLLQQAIWVFIFVSFYQILLFCIQGFIGSLPRTWLYWSPSLTSMILWPWLSIIMRDYRRLIN